MKSGVLGLHRRAEEDSLFFLLFTKISIYPCVTKPEESLATVFFGFFISSWSKAGRRRCQWLLRCGVKPGAEPYIPPGVLGCWVRVLGARGGFPPAGRVPQGGEGAPKEVWLLVVAVLMESSVFCTTEGLCYRKRM